MLKLFIIDELLTVKWYQDHYRTALHLNIANNLWHEMIFFVTSNFCWHYHVISGSRSPHSSGRIEGHYNLLAAAILFLTWSPAQRA